MQEAIVNNKPLCSIHKSEPALQAYVMVYILAVSFLGD